MNYFQVCALSLLSFICTTIGKESYVDDGNGLRTKTLQCSYGNLNQQQTDRRRTKTFYIGWQQNYQPNQHCEYNLSLHNSRINEGKHMKLMIKQLKLEYSLGCNKDSLMVYDANDNLMAKLCGTFKNTNIIVPSSSARLVFKSDSNIERKGVIVKFRHISQSRGALVTCGQGRGNSNGCITCGGTLTAPSGTINMASSIFGGGLNAEYPNNFKCIWNIEPPTEMFIQLTYQFLSIEPQNICAYDSISIYDQYSDGEDPLVTSCGTGCLPSVIVPSNAAIVNFTTDLSVSSYGGFNISYELVSINSIPDINCNCPELNSPANSYACLVFADAIVGPVSTTTTTSEPPSGAGCSGGEGIHTSESGNIMSPNFSPPTGSMYGNNVDCQDIIQVATGMHIRLTFLHFELEAHPSCVWDSLTISTAGQTNETKICGSHSGVRTYSSNEVTLHLSTDGSVTNTGYSILYETIVPEVDENVNDGDSCGGTLTASSGALESPNYPQDYPHNLDCIWTILVDQEKVIKFTKVRFDIEPQSVCSYDKLLYTSGSQQHSFCGQSFPNELVSASNIASFRFTTDHSVARSGFRLEYETVDPADVNDGGGDEGSGDGEADDDVVCGIANGAVARIVGGTNADEDRWPWMVRLFNRNSDFLFCGATLISSRWVLTAAHCVDSYGLYEVGIGGQTDSFGSDRVNIVQVIPHENYNAGTVEDDIALLKLESAVTWSNSTKPVCLTDEDPDVGTECYITGWGNTEGTGDNSVLQEAVVPILAQSVCNSRESYGSEGLTTNMMCAGYLEGGVDTCQGDSGGPLQCKSSPAITSPYFLHGVTSWGYGCADENYPGVYTRVARYMSWIRSNTNNAV